MERKATYLDFEAGEIKEVGEEDTLPIINMPNLLPVLSVYINTDNSDPGTTLGYGVWSSLGTGLAGITTIYYFKRDE